MRKIYIEAKVKLVIRVDDDVDTHELMCDLDVSLDHDKATLEDWSVEDHHITDSK